MPNIKEYDAGAGGLRPTDLGADSLVQAGRRIGAFASETGALLKEQGRDYGRAISGLGSAGAEIYGQAQRQETQAEISHGSAQLATFIDDKNQKWSDTVKNSNVNDTSIRQGFLEKTLEPDLQKFGEAFQTDGGKRWAAERTAAMREHFYQKTAADQATRAGDALAVNAENFKNTTSTTVYADPSIFPLALDNAKTAVQGWVDNSPNLTPAQAEKAKTDLLTHINKELAHSAFKGMADKNPEAAMKVLADGQFDKYITGDERATLQKYGIGIQHMQKADEREARADADRQERKLSEQTFANYFSHVGLDQATGKITLPPGFAQSALTDPRLKGAEKAALISLTEKSEVVKTDWNVVHDLLQRAGSDNPPTRQEVYGLVGTKLTPENANTVFQAMSDKPGAHDDAKIIAEAVRGVEASLPLKSPMTGAALPGNAEMLRRFNAWFYPALEAGRKTNKVSDLLNPGSPANLLTKERLEQFKMSGDDLVSYSREVSQVLNGGKPVPPAADAKRKPLDEIYGRSISAPVPPP